MLAGRPKSSAVGSFSRLVKYFSANCILLSSLMVSVRALFSMSFATLSVLTVPLAITMVWLVYSTMVAFRVLKAYRQASSRLTALTPLNSPSRPSFRPMEMACLATLMDQLAPV